MPMVKRFIRGRESVEEKGPWLVIKYKNVAMGFWTSEISSKQQSNNYTYIYFT